MKHDACDDGVTSVVGEMLLLALVIILVSLFASSAFHLIPGDRQTVVDVSMNLSSDMKTIHFWHKGGDWVDPAELTVTISPKKRNADKRTAKITSIVDYMGEESAIFDLGGYLIAESSVALESGDEIRLVTPKNVIYAGSVKV